MKNLFDLIDKYDYMYEKICNKYDCTTKVWEKFRPNPLANIIDMLTFGKCWRE